MIKEQVQKCCKTCKFVMGRRLYQPGLWQCRKTGMKTVRSVDVAPAHITGKEIRKETERTYYPFCAHSSIGSAGCKSWEPRPPSRWERLKKYLRTNWIGAVIGAALGVTVAILFWEFEIMSWVLTLLEEKP